MTQAKTDSIKRAETKIANPVGAVGFLAEKLHQDNMAGVIFFCSAHYDPETLAAEFRGRFQCPVAGCTTAGEIGSSYQNNGIVAVSFGAEQFRLHPYLIRSLESFSVAEAKTMADTLHSKLEFSSDFQSSDMFGLVLFDGLSVKEEAVTANIYTAMQGLPLVGGSAGDSLDFKETRVFAENEFHTNAGVYILIETKLAFSTFKLQHFEPSGTDLVITEADPSTRTVMGIDGGTAAAEYAENLGLAESELSPSVFSRYPLMLQIGQEWYVRAIQKVNPDGSLTFFCAIDEGLVLTIAKSMGYIDSLKTRVAEFSAEFSKIECTLGCDCILRRLEIQETNQTSETEAVLAPLNFTGFSTFGEQLGSVHISQTLTGVVLGKKHHE